MLQRSSSCNKMHSSQSCESFEIMLGPFTVNSFPTPFHALGKQHAFLGIQLESALPQRRESDLKFLEKFLG
ncbi:hypothetical protein CCR75_004874 [Bremia lactucae]|uniref:Uncharacterized protein n=1 Tax=Bremia lactucae TaxID=4779 RepID=A0A976IHQ5_BRELC|nr:hypothetical protein CCR75_004874 [Bremia lactucae]